MCPRPVVSAWAPLVHLIRTTLAEHGEITLRALPTDHERAATGYVVPNELTIALPTDPDPAVDLATLVYGLHEIGVADNDPRLAESVGWFVEDAAHHTLAAMGVTR